MSASFRKKFSYLLLTSTLILFSGCSTPSNTIKSADQQQSFKKAVTKKAINVPAVPKLALALTPNKAKARRSDPIKILPLGDSITQGGGGFPSYRRSLWFMLNDAGYDVDFIGSHRDFVGYVPKQYIDFDLDHEGHWGWEAGEIDLKLGTWLRNYTPDIVLLHAGTNDFFIDQDNESTTHEIASMIAKLRAKNPKVVILLAKLIPMRDKDTRSINMAIHRLGRTLNTQQSPIVIVDQYSGFSAQNDTHDNYHPNIEGEKIMAKRWFYALTPYL